MDAASYNATDEERPLSASITEPFLLNISIHLRRERGDDQQLINFARHPNGVHIMTTQNNTPPSKVLRKLFPVSALISMGSKTDSALRSLFSVRVASIGGKRCPTVLVDNGVGVVVGVLAPSMVGV